MSNTPTTDPVQTDFEGEEMRAELVAFFQDGLSHVSWWTAATSEEIASALLRGPLAQLQADLIAVRKERDAFEQEVKGLRERLLGATPAGSGSHPTGDAADASSSQSDFDPSRILADLAKQAKDFEESGKTLINPKQYPAGYAQAWEEAHRYCARDLRTLVASWRRP